MQGKDMQLFHTQENATTAIDRSYRYSIRTQERHRVGVTLQPVSTNESNQETIDVTPTRHRRQATIDRQLRVIAASSRRVVQMRDRSVIDGWLDGHLSSYAC
jgi:hypothetical protein